MAAADTRLVVAAGQGPLLTEVILCVRECTERGLSCGAKWFVFLPVAASTSVIRLNIPPHPHTPTPLPPSTHDVPSSLHEPWFCARRGAELASSIAASGVQCTPPVPTGPGALDLTLTDAREMTTVLLARAYFDVREFDHVAHTLRDARGPSATFLRLYARYLVRKFDAGSFHCGYPGYCFTHVLRYLRVLRPGRSGRRRKASNSTVRPWCGNCESLRLLWSSGRPGPALQT